MSLIEILKNTPWWVYAVFIYLLTIGIKSLQPRVVSIKKMFLIPAILLTWAFYTLATKLHTIFDIGLWTLCLVIGTVIGWKLSQLEKMVIDKKNGTVKTGGGPLTLILILLIFASKYYFGYTYATDPTAHDNWIIVIADLTVSGVVTGMFLGRAVYMWRSW